jgi:ubiquinone biosynthesis protein
MASMAPTVDVLAEIVAVVMYFHEHHGERIAREMGLAAGAVPAVDLDGIRASFGITEPVDHLTYQELQERRDLIRRRMEQHQKSRRRRPFKRRR